MDSYSYDVFGAPRTVTGTTANDFQYTGQQRDGNANRGLYYLRARSYDPALGRFLQKDPLGFINRYVYAGNNPINGTDPSGLCWLPDKVCDVANDAKAVLVHTIENPQTLVNGNLANEGIAALIAAFSSCDRHDKEGGIVVYTNCSGAAGVLSRRAFGNPNAFTVGSFVFSTIQPRQAIIAHEFAHVPQYDVLGAGFLPVYEGLAAAAWVSCGGDRTCTERRNPLEIAADLQAGTDVR
ncbi:MAG: hypothetical protein M3P30_11850 [Chloroflexota bacterium]|nr:hypothetical protein [Chloroflexota bacterium]